MNISVGKKFIIISFEDTYLAGDETIILNERYFVFEHDRWDFRYNIFREYLIKNGIKGCFLSASELYTKDKTKEELKTIRDWRRLNNIDVWDLSLIFNGVDFIDNYSNVNKNIEMILNSNIIKRF
jgi:hypothetical protein